MNLGLKRLYKYSLLRKCCEKNVIPARHPAAIYLVVKKIQIREPSSLGSCEIQIQSLSRVYKYLHVFFSKALKKAVRISFQSGEASTLETYFRQNMA